VGAFYCRPKSAMLPSDEKGSDHRMDLMVEAESKTRKRLRTLFIGGFLGAISLQGTLWVLVRLPHALPDPAGSAATWSRVIECASIRPRPACEAARPGRHDVRGGCNPAHAPRWLRRIRSHLNSRPMWTPAETDRGQPGRHRVEGATTRARTTGTQSLVTARTACPACTPSTG
jgi:hypothetical protein